MTKLIEFEKRIISEGHVHTTFKKCSVNDKSDGSQVFVSEDETKKVFNLDDIKDRLSAARFSAPSSIASI